MEKKLGKISRATFGLGGYQDAMIGLHLMFQGEGWGVGTSLCAWDSTLIKHSERCEWTEASRDQEYANIMHKVSSTLADAKVMTVDKLIGMPVEVTTEGSQLVDWRILTEVL